MDNKLIIEFLVIFLIGYRIYILEKFKIKSAADKLFALYYLKNHHPLMGAIVIFYIFEIVFLELALLNRVDIPLIFLGTIELFMVYRHIYISLQTDDKDDYIDIVIKRIFTTLTYSEYQEIKNELYKPQPYWKLYLTELIVLFFSIWYIEIG